MTIVGVHSPEFSFEHDAGNVQRAIQRDGIRYPVVQDNNLATWNAWGNQYWPAEYLIDARGRVRDAHFGEGEYAQTEAAIRSLLAERGGRLGAMPSRATGTRSPRRRRRRPTWARRARSAGRPGALPRPPCRSATSPSAATGA